MFLNDELCMVRPTLININPVELIIIHSRLVQINVLEVAMSYLQKYVFQKKQKPHILHYSTTCTIVQYVIQIKNEIIKHVNVNV